MCSLRDDTRDYGRTSRRGFLHSVATGLAAGTIASAPFGSRLVQAAGAPKSQAGQESPIWSFLTVADPHLRDDDDHVRDNWRTPGTEGWSAPQKFLRMLERVNDLDHQPDFMLLLGDIHVDRYENQIMDHIPMPVYPVVGNHETIEDRERVRALYPDLFGDRDFYSFAHKDCLFIASCNADFSDHIGYFHSEDITPSEGQRTFIQEQLTRGSEYQHCVFFGHIPPHPESEQRRYYLQRQDSRWMNEQIREHSPSAMFFGHHHRQRRFEIGQTPAYIMRSCNWNFDQEPMGFGHVKVFPDRLDVQYHPTLV